MSAELTIRVTTDINHTGVIFEPLELLYENFGVHVSGMVSQKDLGYLNDNCGKQFYICMYANIDNNFTLTNLYYVQINHLFKVELTFLRCHTNIDLTLNIEDALMDHCATVITNQIDDEMMSESTNKTKKTKKKKKPELKRHILLD